MINTTGGGWGSKTVGNQVRVDGSSVEIAQGAADRALSEQMTGLAETLAEISRQLNSPSPDKGLIAGLVESLKQSWVPAAITAVVTTVTKGLLAG